jgi:hypothetical protein
MALVTCNLCRKPISPGSPRVTYEVCGETFDYHPACDAEAVRAEERRQRWVDGEPDAALSP